ncbi:CD225/dispanin family protein [Corynebacterium epidermidicanis]|uniref:Interferon-induced transmembrane protein n=1 Tax=Corynebacterium epidermidicanis TaxID=1050174 RepID=A0A0G3GRT7_9CORY|nr:CD225/dispanin family protein [Corynebacterium epidermidicanis]AKK02248.1 Interferon-induced transmembrane protein [Corynebacterium epidermidicanis]
MTTPQNPFDPTGANNDPARDNANPYGSTEGQSNPYDNAYSSAGSFPTGADAGYQEMGAKPNNYLVWAILSTIFCCLPAGIVSIVFASQVNGRWDAGNYEGARDAAKKAKTWAIISAVVGIIFSVIYGIMVAMGVGMDATNA